MGGYEGRRRRQQETRPSQEKIQTKDFWLKWRMRGQIEKINSTGRNIAKKTLSGPHRFLALNLFKLNRLQLEYDILPWNRVSCACLPPQSEMDFPPFMMGYHKRAKSPIHAEPRQFRIESFYSPNNSHIFQVHW